MDVRGYDYDDLMEFVKRVDAPHRDDLEKLLKLYVDHADLKSTPAACYYHGSEVGGLVDHSCRVTHYLLKLRDVLAPGISDSDCILTGVLHDISKGAIPVVENGKMRMLTRYVPNEKYDPKKPKSAFNRPFDYSKGQIEFQLATSAALIAARFIRGIGINVLQAIAASDGPTVSRSYYHKECPLALLLEYADRWAMYLETRKDRPGFYGVQLAGHQNLGVMEMQFFTEGVVCGAAVADEEASEGRGLS